MTAYGSRTSHLSDPQRTVVERVVGRIDLEVVGPAAREREVVGGVPRSEVTVVPDAPEELRLDQRESSRRRTRRDPATRSSRWTAPPAAPPQPDVDSIAAG